MMIGENVDNAEKSAEQPNQDRPASWKEKIKEPITLFTALVALFTFLLVGVAILQWCTLEKTDRTLKLQTRATVYFRLAAWTDEAPPRPRMSIGNAGLTTTHGLTYASACIYSATGIFDPFKDGAEKMKRNTVSRYTLGPKTLDEGIPVCLSDDVIDPAPKFAYVFGKGSYVDTFSGEHRETQFCFRIDGPPKERRGGRIVGGPCEAGHNCTDEECEKQK